MQPPNIHFFDKNLWHGAWARRSQELTPLYIERYLGPRQSTRISSHAFWELCGAPNSAVVIVPNCIVGKTDG